MYQTTKEYKKMRKNLVNAASSVQNLIDTGAVGNGENKFALKKLRDLLIDIEDVSGSAYYSQRLREILEIYEKELRW